MMSYGTKTKTVVLDVRLSHQFTHKPHCSPPYSKVLSFFMGACIHAHISRKQHHSVKFDRGEQSQDNKQVCAAVHPVNFCIEQKFGKLIVVFDFIE
jgi:hypothetical protein